MKYDILSFVLYLIILAGIVLILPVYWQVSILLALLAIITIVQKISVETDLETAKKKRMKIISIFNEKLDKILNTIQTLGNEFKIAHKEFQTKISELRNQHRIEIETSYRDLTRRINNVENNISKIKRTLAAGLAVLEDRVAELEKMQLTKEEEMDIEKKLTKVFGE